MAQPILAYRDPKMTEKRFFQIFDALSPTSPNRILKKGKYGAVLTVLYSEILLPGEAMDVEIGFFQENKRRKPLKLGDNVIMKEKELPEVKTMATIVHQGFEDHPLAYNSLGRWLEKNQYRIIGNGREVFIENHYPVHPEKCIMEIQLPVERIDITDFNLKPLSDS